MIDTFLYASRAVLPLLLTISLGYFVRRRCRWGDDFFRQLNAFCFHVLLPVQLFLNVYSVTDLTVLNWRLMSFIFVCVLLAIAMGAAAARLTTSDRAQQGVIVQAIYRSNLVIMGIALASSLGGPEAAAFASMVVALYVPFYNMSAVVVLAVYGRSSTRIDWRSILKDILRNPLIIGAALGLAAVLLRGWIPRVGGVPVFSLETSLPSVYKTLQDISKASSPLILMVLGAQIRFDRSRELRRPLAVCVVMRLIVVPAVLLTVTIALRRPLGLTTVEMPALVGAFCSPIAVTSAVMAQEIGGDVQLATQAVAWTCALSMFTIFGFTVLLRTLGYL